ncbi:MULTISPECIES: hypothetical protein [unclassified Nostoc]|nr:hypothetical protein [Nostoc sp. S13]MDF5734647.1 hypothetical protein [Nostoc sp. S13]
MIERIREAIALCLQFEDEQDSLDFVDAINRVYMRLLGLSELY